ncbi:hypothetical protein [uncultured Tenacibaculum sp.]|uniref:hypothetical protein n=1 Tax=uncultured Tenacibaculum sp. TaxID=174713 RepID=UPI0026291F6B|nr:hypothetical protein [uncultured Tenacibaculum sp.]
MKIGFTNPKSLYIIFGIFLLLGLYIIFFVAFNQHVMNKYVVAFFGVFLTYLGGVGIYKTRQFPKQ